MSELYFYIARQGHPNQIIYTENVQEYLNDVGVETREIVLGANGSARPELQACLNGDALGILGYIWDLDHSCIGDRFFLDLAAEAKVPVVQWLLDHPSTLWPAFATSTAQNSGFLFLSGYSEAYFRRFIMPNCRSGWVMGTGTSRHSRVASGTRESFLSREIKCLLPINLRRIGGTKEDAERRLEALPAHLAAAVMRAVELAQYDLEQPIENHFFNNAPPRALLEAPNMLHHCIQIIEEIVQTRRRFTVFAVAREFPVSIQSDVRFLPHLGTAELSSNVGMKDTFIRMRRSRAVVSLSHINDEVHNRTLNGLNAGAVNIIEANVAHRSLFTHRQNALLFRYDDDSLRECLDLVCGDPDAAYEIALAGMELRDDPRLRHAGFRNFIRLTSDIHQSPA